MKSTVFRDCAVHEGKIYFITETPGFYPLCMDLKSLKISPWDIKNMGEFQPCLYDKLLADNEYIYAISGAFDCVMKYSLTDRVIENYFAEKPKTVWNMIAHAELYENVLFAFGRTGEMLIVDTKTGSIKQERYPVKDGYWSVSGCRCGNSIVLFPKSGEEILKYNMQKRTWENILLSSSVTDIVQVKYYGGLFYVIQEDGTVLSWDENVLDEVYRVSANINGDMVDCSCVCMAEEEILILPQKKENIWHVKNNIARREVSYPEDFCYKNDIWGKYYGYGENNENWYFTPRVSDYILCISKKTGDIQWLSSKVDEAVLFKYELMKNPFVYENEIIGLCNFVKAITV